MFSDTVPSMFALNRPPRIAPFHARFERTVRCGVKLGDISVTFGDEFVNGVPVANAGIVFHPKDGKGRPASAETDQDGNYRLTTFSAGDGLDFAERRNQLIAGRPV